MKKIILTKKRPTDRLVSQSRSLAKNSDFSETFLDLEQSLQKSKWEKRKNRLRKKRVARVKKSKLQLQKERIERVEKRKQIYWKENY